LHCIFFSRKSFAKTVQASLRHVKRINYKVKLKEKINFGNTRGYFFFPPFSGSGGGKAVIFIFVLGAGVGSCPVDNLTIRTRFVIKRSVTWKARPSLSGPLCNDGAIKLRLL